MEFHDLGNRIRAARGYAGGMSQEELATQLNMSLGWLKTVESGRGVKEIEALGVIERVSGICHIPKAWFTADWSQLDPGYEPPEDHLQRLESTVDSLAARLEQLAQAGEALRQETKGAHAELLAGQRKTPERLQPFAKRLDRIEREQVSVETFTQAVDLIRQAIDELAARLPPAKNTKR